VRAWLLAAALLVAPTFARAEEAGAAGGDSTPASRAPMTPVEHERPAPPPARDVAPIVKKVFERGYPFCKDAEYPLTSEEVDWCDLLPDGGKKPDPRCPRLAELCAKGPQAQLMGRQRFRHSKGFTFEGPHIPSAVVWVLLALGVAVVLHRLLGQSLSLGAPDAKAERQDDARVDDAAARAAALKIVETDVERLLARARAAAAAGDFERGVGDAYAALLRKLEGAGVVRVEPNRTNGDHLREVARKLPDAAPEMRPLVRAVERAQFAGAGADEAAFRFVLDGVVRLLAGKLAALAPLVVGVGLLSLLAGCRQDREDWDESPSGSAGVLEVLRQYGFEARERLVALSRLSDKGAGGGEGVDVIVLMPDVEVAKDDWKKLETWVSAGGGLVVAGAARELPDWIPVELDVKTPGLVSAPLRGSARLSSWFTGKHLRVPRGHALKIKKTAEAPAVSEADDRHRAARDDDDDDEDDEDDDEAPDGMWPLLLRGDAPYAAEGFVGDGRVVVLADERLFTNVALLVPDDAALVTDLLRRDGKRVEVADGLTGLVSPNPLASVSRGQLAPALAQLALVVLLFFLWKGAHFGRPRDPVLSRRRAFAEHARALGVQYGRARAARHALWLYGAFALERLRERLRLAGGKGLSSVAEGVAARTGRPLGEVMRLLVEARPDPEAPAPTGPGTGSSRSARSAAVAAQQAADLASLREIATLLSQTGGAGERSRIPGQG
jgi:hypothetical protein